MSRKEVTVTEWTCEGCGAVVRMEKTTPNPPRGWVTVTTTIGVGLGEGTQGLDLCQTCAKDPEAAAKRYRASIGQG